MSYLVSASGSLLISASGSYIASSDTVFLTLTCPTNSGTVGTAYSSAYIVGLGTPAYAFTLISGAIPTGLSLNAITGAITGTPSVAGLYTFDVQCIDSLGATLITTCSINILSAANAKSGIYKLVPAQTHDTLYLNISTPTTQNLKIPNPFIETALLGEGGQEDILHWGGYRIRIKGTGTLRATLKGLDSVSTQTLATLTMSQTPGKEPAILSNFKSQRTLLRLETTAIDETFDINRIILFVRKLWTEFPR